MRKLLLLLALVCPALAQADVTFYGECDYKGNGVPLAPGDYTARELSKFGIPEDAIRSIDVPRGYAVTVYENDGFKGRYGTLRRSDECLDNDRFSGVISSLSVRKTFGSIAQTKPKPVAAATNAVTLYTECQFGGTSAALDEGDYNLAQLKRLGIPNNSISSVKVPEGFTVTLYQNDFLRGKAGELARNDSCLTNDNFDNVISSVSVRKTGKLAQQAPAKPKREVPATLYVGCEYTGGTADLPIGEYDAAKLKSKGFRNNTISAIKVGEGYQVELFENDFFRGRSGTLRQDDPCLVDDRFNDTITSLIVSKDPRYQKKEEVVAKPDVLTVFAHCNYKGGSVSMPEGRYTQSGLLKIKIKSNVISSLKVKKGYQVTVYDSGNFSGQGKVFSGNDSCLDDDGMNERISSLVVEPAKKKAANTFRELLSEVKPAEKNQYEDVNKALTCVEQYVERGICDAHRWRDMASRCGVDKIAVLNDGYLRGHVNAGNCKPEYWSELARRSANPSLR